MKTITQPKSKHRFYLLLLILLCSLHTHTLFAQQQIQLKGVVSDNSDILPGVSVTIKGTTQGTLTDVNGVYNLIAKGNDTLVFSYIGYKTAEIPVNNRQTINITLQEDTTLLNEVVINAGYYNVKDRERTGSIARVTAKDIEFQPVVNPLQAIQGRMAGVSITQYSGVPGGGFDIQIRGRNSLRIKGSSIIDGNLPLYIIDGIPIWSGKITDSGFSAAILPMADSNPLNSIDPNNIESIEILKDADATAIYGSRGANGVVLITTKKGKAGKTTFTVSSSTAFSKTASKMKLMNTEQFNQMREEAFANDDITEYPANAYDMNGTWERNRYTDWQKELIGGTAISKNIQLGINGGNEYTRFTLSAGHNEETTVFPTYNGYKRNSFLFNLNHVSKDSKLQINTSTSYSVQSNNLIQTDLTKTSLTLAPNAPALYNEDGTLNWQEGTFDNPLAPMGATYNYDNKNLLLNANIRYNVLPNTFVKLNLGVTNNNFQENTLTPYTTYNPAYNLTSEHSNAQKASFNTNSLIVEPQINWFKDFNNHYKLDILLGGAYLSNTRDSFSIYGTGFISDALLTNIGAANNKIISSITNSKYNYAAVFSRFNFSYRDKYIFNLTARRDGSSRFGDNNRFGNFGAVGTAWVFTEENFLKNNNWLNFGKIRASYGTAGSDNIGDYQYLDTYTLSTTKYGGTVGLNPSRLYNPDFSWEKTTKLETALELGLFNDRIHTSIAWYKNRSSNQLVGIPLPGTTGFSSIQANLDATVENSGWEFTLNTVNLQNTDWYWTTNFNISFPKNKLVSFPDLEGSTYADQFVVGEPTSIRKVYHYEGVNPETGLYQFTDYDNDGKLTPTEDKQMIKEIGVQYYGGVQNTVSYKNISLDFLFQFVKQQGYNYNQAIILPGILRNQPIEVLDHFNLENKNASYSFYSTGVNSEALNNSFLLQESDKAISDASYIRLKNISLSYTLKIPKVKIESLKLYFQGQNLWTITNYFGLDPESGSNYLPPLKTYAFGFQLTF
ncbi:SusC/RagA family TonB-linked outer membrane protein [Myroides indicus]|uniref:TonB-linked SusC/RagA family outer membrane protein n=1 Tax=Myroides indicus TaxID=1323422 RepID=A0A4R7ETR8_9FLAO|nr:SusC/RagA family TonB-linked outer membrane protein [Myroides indicus]TDS52423.1 TonB-linked SusC/RagA family outer membrane protein [Myroides indicus]